MREKKLCIMCHFYVSFEEEEYLEIEGYWDVINGCRLGGWLGLEIISVYLFDFFGVGLVT